MKLAFAALAALVGALGCSGSSCARESAPPPVEQERLTALGSFRAEIAASKDDAARRELAERIVEVDAQQGAAFASHGDAYVHHDYPEPPYECLMAGTCFADYTRHLFEAQRQDTPPLADRDARVARLLQTLDLAKLEANLARRERYVASVLPDLAPARVRGDGPRTVYVLTTGHPVERRRDATIDRLQREHPGRVRVVEIARDTHRQVFDVLGDRLTAVAFVDGKLHKDFSEYEQWLELLVPDAPFPPVTHAVDPVYDAHAHLATDGAPRLRAFLADERIVGAVVAALPGPPDGSRLSVENARVLTTGAPELLPLVTVDHHLADPTAELRRLLDGGARGLKLMTGHGDYHKGVGAPLLDAAWIRPVFAELQARSLPVLWHVNTHLYSAGFIRVLHDYPNLKVVNPHLGGYLSYAPGILRRLLETYSNLYVDLSFGTQVEYLRHSFEDISARHEVWRKLLIDHADRFLFGADMVVTPTTSRAHARALYGLYRALLETERFDFHYVPARGTSPLHEVGHHHDGMHGLALPREVLQKIYFDNAARIYGAKMP